MEGFYAPVPNTEPLTTPNVLSKDVSRNDSREFQNAVKMQPKLHQCANLTNIELVQA